MTDDVEEFDIKEIDAAVLREAVAERMLSSHGGGEGAVVPRHEDIFESLRIACHIDGFFYLNLGKAGKELELRALSAARDFFALPINDKMSISNTKSAQYRGYIRFGAEITRRKPDMREQVEFGVEKAAHDPKEYPRLPLYARLVGPNQWPSPRLLPKFRSEIEWCASQLEGAASILMRALAICLGFSPATFDECFLPWPNVQYKICRYGNKESASGVGIHCDSGMLTLLVQDPNASGLEAFSFRQNVWRSVHPRSGCIVINLGEMLEKATGGYFRATPHRVKNPSSSGSRERYSFPYFYNAALRAPMKQMIASNALRWDRPKSSQSLTEDNDNVMLSIYGNNALKSLARSHAACTAKHHPDIRVMKNGEVRPIVIRGRM